MFLKLNALARKQLGAYYTDVRVAEFLVRWALRNPNDQVMDPACGDGIFLAAAVRGAIEYGSGTFPTAIGIDVDSEALSSLAVTDLRGVRLVNADFFQTEPGDLPLVDAVVGNPPFVRYQRFDSISRAKALEACQRVGVSLPRLVSTWAPFLVHSTRFLKPGGRLAMVVPTEINHAAYAANVVDHFVRSFQRIVVLAFRHRLFPDLSQDTFCILAEGYGAPCESFQFIVLNGMEDLAGADLSAGVEVDIPSIQHGKVRLLEYLLPVKARKLYHDLSDVPEVMRLGKLCDVGIGYVSGSNEFFHLSTSEVERFQIPPYLLRPAVVSAQQLRGLRFTVADWHAGEELDLKVWLLSLPADQVLLPSSIREYLRVGEELGVSQQFKCRVRKRWYSVPNVYVGDAFLTYMSGHTPSLVCNQARTVAPNTLHVVQLLQPAAVAPISLSFSWHTSLTIMSGEMEGHALGGGMLKLEPSEAEAVRMALPNVRPSLKTYEDVDTLLRTGQREAANEMVDHLLLVEGLGLSRTECATLLDGAHLLRTWRLRKPELFAKQASLPCEMEIGRRQ